MQKTNSAIDISKFFFCLCIIALHAKLFSAFSEMVDYYVTQSVLRLAVPFFFVTSGYFLGMKLVKSDIGQYKELVLNYCKRLLLPLLFFDAVNLVERGVYDYVHGKAILFIVSKSIKSIIFYPPGALWFLQACIIGALLLLPFLKSKKLNFALVFGAVLYMFALLCNNYFFLIEDTPFQRIVDVYMSYCHTARNGLFVGFIFLGLGVKCVYSEMLQRVGNQLFMICLWGGYLHWK